MKTGLKIAKIKRATELQYLRWFYQMADFGPADGEVRDCMLEDFMNETDMNAPEDYNIFSDGETCADQS